MRLKMTMEREKPECINFHCDDYGNATTEPVQATIFITVTDADGTVLDSSGLCKDCAEAVDAGTAFGVLGMNPKVITKA